MYGRSRVSVKVERGLTFTFTRGLSYIVSISFMHLKITCVLTEKLRDSANQPLLSRARRKTQSNTKRERRAQYARPTNGKVTPYRVFRLVFLSYLFSFVNLSPTLHTGVSLFVCLFFWARPRGKLIATAIIIATGKLRINLSQEGPNSLSVQRPNLLHCKIRLPAMRSFVHTKPVNPIIEIATF